MSTAFASGWMRVGGNHDRVAGSLPAGLAIEERDGPTETAGLEVAREPPAAAREGGGPTLAGHLHPVARLRDGGRDRARMPCFWLRDRCLVLPAWGTFTGGHPVRATPGDRVFVPVEGTVLEVPLG